MQVELVGVAKASKVWPKIAYSFAKKLRQCIQAFRQNLGRVFNSRSGCVCPMQLLCRATKLPSLELKTGASQISMSLPLAFALYDWNLIACFRGEEGEEVLGGQLPGANVIKLFMSVRNKLEVGPLQAFPA